MLKEGAPPLLTHLSGATVSHCLYEHERNGRYELRYASDVSKNSSRMESVLRLDLDVWSPAGVALAINPPPSRVSAVSRHRLSEKGSGCWITIEQDGGPAEVSITIEKSSDSATPTARVVPVVSVNGENIKVVREELDDAEIQTRRVQKRIANRAIMLDRNPTPRTTSHFGRPPSIAEVTTATPKLTSRAATPTMHRRMPSLANVENVSNPSDPQGKLPIHYAFDALSALQQLHKETAEARVDASEWTILSYAENNLPIRISKRMFPSVSPNLPLYRVERTLPGVSEEQLLRLIQTSSTKVRTAWDERLSSTENIAHYNNGGSTGIWIAQASFPTRSRIAYMATVRAREEVKAGPAGGQQNAYVTYIATSSVPLSAFDVDCVESRAIVAAERLNPSKLLEACIPLEGWVIETSVTAKDDEDEDSELQMYTKCSLYTCSDLPLMMAGTFGQAALRSRLARMFDLLEANSKTVTTGCIPRLPSPAFSVSNENQNVAHKWTIRPAQRCASVIASLSNSVILKIQLPALPAGLSGISQDADASSIFGQSGISQRSFGGRSVEVENVEQARGGSDVDDGTRQASKTAADDVVIAEIVLNRESNILGFDVKSTTTLSGATVLPKDTSFWKKLSPPPYKAELYQLKTQAKVPHSYLLRVSLPTSQYTSPLDHPLSVQVGAPSLPRWYRKLASEPGVVQLQVSTVKASSQTDGRPTAAVKLTFDGIEVPLTFGSDRMDSEEDWPLDELVL